MGTQDAPMRTTVAIDGDRVTPLAGRSQNVAPDWTPWGPAIALSCPRQVGSEDSIRWWRARDRAVDGGRRSRGPRPVPSGHRRDPDRCAFDTIRRSIDPCGESAQIVDMVDRFERCTRASYEICTDGTASRNLREPRGVDERGTIIWNPALRSELRRGCDGDPARPVMRDPWRRCCTSSSTRWTTAKDATRRRVSWRPSVEDVYRRAVGLCQRSGYGDQLLGAEARRACALPADSSSVAAAGREPAPERETPRPAPGGRGAESVSTTGETEGHPARDVLADAPVFDSRD
jgi:hypothetical protein